MNKRTLWIVVGAILCFVVIVGAVVAYIELNQPASVEKPTIKIGYFGPLTGSGAPYGTGVLEAIYIAVDEINSAGGINGSKIQVVVYDDAATSSQAITVAHKMIENDGVVAAISGSFSSATAAAAPVFQSGKVPMIAAYAVLPAITLAGSYCFRYMQYMTVNGESMAWYAVKSMNITSFAILSSNTDWAVGLSDALKSEAESLGATVVYYEKYPYGETDFTPYLTAIKDLHPQAIYMSGYYDELGIEVPQARNLGITAQILSNDGMDSPYFFEAAGNASYNVVATSNFAIDDPNNPLIGPFVSSFEARWGRAPQGDDPQGYDCIYLLANAIKTNGTQPDQIRQGLMNTVDFNGVCGVLTHFTAGREVVRGQLIVKSDGTAFHYLTRVEELSIITPPV